LNLLKTLLNFKGIIYLIIFLMPLASLLGISPDFDFSKQVILVFLSLLAFLAWLWHGLVSRQINIKKGYVEITMLLLVCALFLSAVFSNDSWGSFWGRPKVISEAFINMVALAVVFFIISFTFLKEDKEKAIRIFSFSAILAMVLGFFGINTIGSPICLAIFSACLVSFFIFLSAESEKWQYKLFFILGLVVSLASLFLIMQKPAQELYLSQKQSYLTAQKMLEGRMFFGAGQGTFSYNAGGVVFNRGISKFATDLGSTGILGILALLGFIISIFISGWKGRNFALLSFFAMQAVGLFFFNFYLAQLSVFFMTAGLINSVDK